MIQTQYIQGKEISEQMKKRVETEIQKMQIRPKVVTLLCTQDEAACYYAQSQKKYLEKAGITSEILRLGEDASESQIISSIQECNFDSNINGILVVMPLPPGVNRYRVRQAISPEKDIEGVTPANMGKLFYGDFSLAPCTAKAVWLILQSTSVDLAGKDVVVISHSEIVGKPLLAMLLYSWDSSPTPTCCHIATKNLSDYTRRADIVVVAVGKAGFLKRNMIKPGAIVVDVGINMLDDPISGKRKAVGDAEEMDGVAGMITPVPGGVGTVTTGVLLENCLTLITRQKGYSDKKDNQKKG